MIIDCISDLHGHFPELDGGDILIVAGDLTASDKAYQFIEFFLWLDKQNYRKKIIIAGNHDNVLQIVPPITESLPDNISYLCDSGTEFETLKIWGSPWTKSFIGMNENCKAFTVFDDTLLAAKWDLIPHDTNILITHSPPYGFLDRVQDWASESFFEVGSASLLKWQIRHAHMLKLHVFGHIHEGYGIMGREAPYLVNASHMNVDYQPVNPPIRIIL